MKMGSHISQQIHGSNFTLVSQLSNLIKIFDSAKNWVVPEKDIRKNLDIAVPIAKDHINAAILAARQGNLFDTEANLKAAYIVFVKYSHLGFK